MKIHCRNCRFFTIKRSMGVQYGCKLFAFLGPDYPPEKYLYLSTGSPCDKGILRNEKKDLEKDSDSGQLDSFENDKKRPIKNSDWLA